jgi:hypothetical protein
MATFWCQFARKMSDTAKLAGMQTHVSPPERPLDVVRQLGPGLIISANIVGAGELIVTTKLGADAGFTLLWFIILGCAVKVLLQIELGRYAILNGKTTLRALDDVPGPRIKVSWMVWCWLAMFIATFVQLSGIVGGVAGVIRTGGLDWPDWQLALAITGSCGLLLVIGRYAFIERFSTTMVAASEPLSSSTILTGVSKRATQDSWARKKTRPSGSRGRAAGSASCNGTRGSRWSSTRRQRWRFTCWARRS